MSLRHVSRLKQQQQDEKNELSEEEEDDDEGDALDTSGRRTQFQLLDSSSGSSDDEGEEETDDEDSDQQEGIDGSTAAPGVGAVSTAGAEKARRVEPGPRPSDRPPSRKKQSSRGSKPQQDVEDEEDEDLLLLGGAAAQAAAQDGPQGDGAEGGAVPAPGAAGLKWLSLDARSLNIEREIEARFGAVMAVEAAGPNRRAGGRRGLAPRARGGQGSALAQLYLRKCMLGPPREEWARAPTFVGGGLRLVRTDPPKDYEDDPRECACEWYRYEHSAAYQQLQRDFEVVQSTHDPNALAVFLAHQPYHVDGLLTLAMLFAHTGQLERATEYVRRCLFVLESAYCESFRPAEPGGAAASYRMSIAESENRPYFMALFRHIQMASGRGLYRTGFEVAKLLLSLDPTGDPTGILLAVDYLAIRAERGAALLALAESGLSVRLPPKGRQGDRDDEEKGGGGENDDEGKRQQKSKSQGDKEDDDDEGEAKDQQQQQPGVVTVAALPNLAYSCSLAHYYNGKRGEAVRALGVALRRFPVVLAPLVARCRNDLGSKVTQPWDSMVLRHAFFSGAAARLPPGHVLVHLAHLYVVRSCELWKTEETLQLLFEAAADTLRQLETAGWSYDDEERELRTSYFPGSPLERYLAASPSDFVDEFESLPNDVNPLDPALMDPAIARRGRLRILQPGVQQQFQRQRAFFMMQNARARAAAYGGANLLNPDLPLMELFWRTLLPWNRIDDRRGMGRF